MKHRLCTGTVTALLALAALGGCSEQVEANPKPFRRTPAATQTAEPARGADEDLDAARDLLPQVSQRDAGRR